MSGPSRLLAVALAGAAAGATAAPFLSIGRNAELLLTGAVSVRFDDNVFLDRNGGESDVLFMIVPGVSFGYDGGATQVSARVEEELLRYAENTGSNSDLTGVDFSVQHNRPRGGISASVGYREYGQNNLAAFSVGQTVRRNQLRAGATAEFAFTEKTRLGVGASYDRARYPGSGFIDSESWEFPADVYFTVTPKLDLSVGYRHRRSTLENGLNDSRDDFWNVGARGEFTPKLTGQVRVGQTRRKFERGDRGTQLGVTADLAYALSPKSSLQLAVTNDFSTSALGDSQEELRASLSGRFALSEQWNLGTSVSFSSADYESGRTDRFTVAQLDATYVLTTSTSFQAAYLFRRNSADPAAFSFDNNVLSLATSVRY